MFSENSDRCIPNCESDDSDHSTKVHIIEGAKCNDSDQSQKICSTEEVVANADHSEESSVLDRLQEKSCPEESTQPILQKIFNLSDSVKNLKKEHSQLSHQVKGIMVDPFPGSEVLTTFRRLNDDYELLKKKYLEESLERKRLYNDVIELKGNIRVFCRCRPLNQVEIANGSSSVVDFESAPENELQIISSDCRKQFKFDHVFRPEDSQEAVFAQTKPIVTSVLDGYNVCIFAYGQTGTGKTFTMEGNPENRGVNYRTLEELFAISKERSNILRYELYVSMVEVYNEKIRDLLVENSNQPSKKLEIKQAAEGTLEVPGLVETRVYSTEEVWEVLKYGSRARSVGSTSANELSSRSHCLLRVTVKGENLINGQRTKSHLWLVDLAGSERVGKIEVEGERLKESQFINKSLSALGDVISALAYKTGHIPYRNSKLTHMLQSSLGGDCKTVMFVQISPSAADLGETLCSLNFASRVRGIESGPARKQADHSELFKYKQMAEKLKHDEKETKKLQDNLQFLQLRLAAREHTCRSLQEKVRDLENQLADERKTRLKQETRAFAAASSSCQPSALSSAYHAADRAKMDKKPPLGPSRQRMPLRRITNFMPPPPSPFLYHKLTTLKNSAAAAIDNKENTSKLTTASNTNSLLKPRRVSIAIGPPTTTTKPAKSLQPKRRVSIATIRPEPSTFMTTPLRTSLNNGSSMKRKSLVQDPRKARYSRLFSPLPKLSEATPVAMRSSSKFMRSPPVSQATGSWKPTHPTVVALQRKSLIWSPLKLRGNMKNQKKSQF